MKKFLLFFALSAFALSSFAQDSKQMPNATIKTLEGENVKITDVIEKGKITVISFWATWCTPCRKELDAIMDYYEDWQEDYNMELIAISTDDARSMSKVKPVVEDSGWDYRIYLDPARDLQTAASVPSVPFTMVIDQNGNVIYEHTGYNTGDELELEELLEELSDSE